MAAFVFIACSIAGELHKISNVFIKSGYSLYECWNYLVTTRRKIIIERYLKCLVDSDDEQNNLLLKVKKDNKRIVKKKLNSAKSIICGDKNMIINNNNNNTNTNDDADVEFDFGDDIIDAYANIPIESPTMVETDCIPEPGLVYSCRTLNVLTPGTSFYISGTILRNCERFSINLTYGNKDIALHINPRLPQNYIVRNSYVNGYWDKEEVTSALPFTLKRGCPFIIQILVTELEYYISVNGHHFAAYKHRMPYNRVRGLQVKGDVTDIEVEEVPVMEYPDKLPDTETKLIQSVPTVNFTEINQLNHQQMILRLPYYGKFSEKFGIGKCLHILGRVKVLPHSFFINLQQGDKIWPHPIIAFHLNPRFANVGAKHIICRNTWHNGKWDKEERTEIFTDFMPSRSFHMTINCTHSAYNVILNGKLIADYKYRIDPDIVDTIYIQGDINLKEIILETISSETTTTDQDISAFNDLEELQ